nr:tRNA preQ1(34) S-adenosylmethionine ribosyltransferase-isomerase QueA [Maliibacterium massiliense]
MKTSDFDYALPQELIAQHPVEPRDHSRMMVCHRDTGLREHKHFYNLPDFLRPGDVLVINNTKVIPARLFGVREGTGAKVELLLLKRESRDVWETLARPAKRLRKGAIVVFGEGALRAQIIEELPEGGRRVRFMYAGVFEELLDRLGNMPLPPYIHEQLEDKNRYQTVYAKTEGSAAAPTAGLHFTPELMQRITDKGAAFVPLLLHVGLGTFRPVKEEDVEKHIMHSEYYELTQSAVEAIEACKARGNRVFAVGTTSVRVLQTAAQKDGRLHAGSGWTDIFITPGFTFHVMDGLITNFHLPQSTLLMLISAWMGREQALAAYEEAVRERYRFFSFGDAMLIV